jgi:hypothetical protein
VIGPDSSLVDVCFAVCTELERRGVTAVLTGGSAATYYAPEGYQSDDADFVLVIYANGADVTAALRELGYEHRNSMFVHATNPFTVEFPRGPLAIGIDFVRTWRTVRRADETLHVLTPTDSVRDRLANFYYFRDRASMHVAVAVASAQVDAVDLVAIEDWTRREAEGASAYAQLERFAEFVTALDRARAGTSGEDNA